MSIVFSVFGTQHNRQPVFTYSSSAITGRHIESMSRVFYCGLIFLSLLDKNCLAQGPFKWTMNLSVMPKVIHCNHLIPSLFTERSPPWGLHEQREPKAYGTFRLWGFLYILVHKELALTERPPVLSSHVTYISSKMVHRNTPHRCRHTFCTHALRDNGRRSWDDKTNKQTLAYYSGLLSLYSW